MILLIILAKAFGLPFPRTRGDDPKRQEILSLNLLFSPHPRG